MTKLRTLKMMRIAGYVTLLLILISVDNHPLISGVGRPIAVVVGIALVGVGMWFDKTKMRKFARR